LRPEYESILDEQVNRFPETSAALPKASLRVCSAVSSHQFPDSPGVNRQDLLYQVYWIAEKATCKGTKKPCERGYKAVKVRVRSVTFSDGRLSLLSFKCSTRIPHARQSILDGRPRRPVTFSAIRLRDKIAKPRGQFKGASVVEGDFRRSFAGDGQ
jgi:hypothetical protein